MHNITNKSECSTDRSKPSSATIIDFPQMLTPANKDAFRLENKIFRKNVSSILDIDMINSLDAVEDMICKEKLHEYDFLLLPRIIQETPKLVTEVFDSYETEGKLELTIKGNYHTYNWMINFTDENRRDVDVSTALVTEKINRQLVYLLP